MEPPPSVPVDSAPMPVATAAEEPPLEPPGVVDRSHGLRVMPVSGLSVTPFQASSGVVVLPTRIAPCSRRRAVTGESTSQDASWDEDSPVTARLREQGAILVGKTTTPELAWKGVTDSPLTGIPRNPRQLSTKIGRQ